MIFPIQPASGYFVSIKKWKRKRLFSAAVISFLFQSIWENGVFSLSVPPAPRAWRIDGQTETSKDVGGKGKEGKELFYSPSPHPSQLLAAPETTTTVEYMNAED